MSSHDQLRVELNDRLRQLNLEKSELTDIKLAPRCLSPTCDKSRCDSGELYLNEEIYADGIQRINKEIDDEKYTIKTLSCTIYDKIKNYDKIRSCTDRVSNLVKRLKTFVDRESELLSTCEYRDHFERVYVNNQSIMSVIAQLALIDSLDRLESERVELKRRYDRIPEFNCEEHKDNACDCYWDSEEYHDGEYYCDQLSHVDTRIKDTTKQLYA